MFVRLSKHLDSVKKAASARAACDHLVAERKRLQAEALAARKEVRRLTDIIVRMKQEGYSTHAGDQTWGRYTFDEVDGQGSAPGGGGTGIHEDGFTNEEVAVAEAEVAAELQKLFDDE